MFLQALEIIKTRLEKQGLKVYLDFSDTRDESVYLEIQEYDYNNTLNGKTLTLIVNISCIGIYAKQTIVIPVLEEMTNKVNKALNIDKSFKFMSTTLDISPNPIIMAQTTTTLTIEKDQ